jgi:hypothetical protein
MSESQFVEEVAGAIKLYEQANHRAATRTRQMIEEHGEVEALSRLMISPDLQQGFKVLRDGDQLDKTFEAIVIRYQSLFSQQAIEAAQWRLDHPYDLL